MKKVISSRELARIKGVVKLLLPEVAKREKLLEKMKELDIINATIDSMEAGFKPLTGGMSTLDLINKVVEPAFNEDGSPKLDDKGKQVNKTTFVPNPKYLVPTGQNGGYMLNTESWEEGAEATSENEQSGTTEEPAVKEPESATEEPETPAQTVEEDPFNF